MQNYYKKLVIVRFIRKDNKPDEEYYYNSLESAREHFKLFIGDESGLYEVVLIEEYDGTEPRLIEKNQC